MCTSILCIYYELDIYKKSWLKAMSHKQPIGILINIIKQEKEQKYFNDMKNKQKMRS